MPVYRGAGGAGDATADASNTSAIALAAATEAELSAATAANAATTATTQGTSATASATAAASSASAASSSASSASTSATNAAASASTATTQASNASASASTATTQASNASTSATTATTQAGIATTQATNASTSATNAEASATSAAASYDSFDDRYLGAKSSDPSVDNDGNALLTGALYWNSVSNVMKAWTGSTWLVNYVPSTGFLTTSDIGTTVQANLTSGTNIKTINSTSLLGSGDITTGDVTLTGTQTLTNKTITGFKETSTASSSNNFNLANANYFTHTVSGATTFTVSNTATSGSVSTLILNLTNGGSATITWWSGMKWAAGTAPTLTSAGRDVLGFFTYDGGTTWSGLVLAKDIK